MPLLNLGIVAHVDAGKTSLTERLLFEAGVLTAPGSVDAGTTQTDSMDIERRRGITIRAAVTSFDLDDLTVNLLDTPGHPDFIAEVERSLTVLDGAVMVLSAVEGVQPQSVVIWRALRRLAVPTLLFVNKVDRGGADVAAVVAQVRRRMTPHAVFLTDVVDQGTARAFVRRRPLDHPDVLDFLTTIDDRLLAAWAENPSLPPSSIRHALRGAVASGAASVLTCGSALTGAGVPELRQAIRDLLPRATCSANDSTAATVFAADRDERGRRAYLRIWSGRLRARDRVSVAGRVPEKVTELQVSRHGRFWPATSGGPGDVVAVRGLAGARVGDTFGPVPQRRDARILPPTLQALVEPVDPRQRTALFSALGELAEEDPLIGLRLDEAAGEVAVTLHGAVQREVIGSLLEERYGVPVRFRQPSTLCVERVTGVGEAVERIKVDGNPYLATIGLRVEPAAPESGVAFLAGVERGRLPPAFVAATEEGVRAALLHGRFGWEVIDCQVTMTASGYWPRQSRPHQKFDKAISSVAADFRNLAPVVVSAALAEAGTRVCQPIDQIDLELPETALDAVLSELGRFGGVVTEVEPASGQVAVGGTLPTARVPELTQRLPDLTGGEGVLVATLARYDPVTARPPVRRRIGVDPGDRRTWFREMPR